MFNKELRFIFSSVCILIIVSIVFFRNISLLTKQDTKHNNLNSQIVDVILNLELVDNIDIIEEIDFLIDLESIDCFIA